MTVEELIRIAAERTPQRLEVEQAATAAGRSSEEICDLLSRTVAQRYLAGEYRYAFADVVMNNLFAYLSVFSARGMPDLSFGVYLAFDAGEYMKGGEFRTRELLGRLRDLVDA